MRQRFLALLLIFALLSMQISVSAEESSSPLFEEIQGKRYVNLSILAETSDIQVEAFAQGVRLSEDGLQINLSADSPLIFRGDVILAVMSAPVILENGVWYAPADFYEEFLCQGDKPSLFHGALFYGYEILEALAQPETPFHQKLLSAISLPTSMGLHVPHLDMARVFSETPLSAFPSELAETLKNLGYADAETFTYSEYEILSGMQTLSDAGLASTLNSYPELQNADPDKMTVAAFRAWQAQYDLEQYQAGLTDAEQEFLAEKSITIKDFQYLDRYFYGACLEQSDDALQEALTIYYDTDLAFLKTTLPSFSDVLETDWFYDAALYAVTRNLMKLSDNQSFQPAATVTRAEAVTTLWLYAGKPVVNYALRYQDVPPGEWYTEAVRWAASEKFMTGYEDTIFGPEDPITREQLAALFYRYAQKQTDSPWDAPTYQISFQDRSALSEWAYQPVCWCFITGIFVGKSEKILDPQGAVLRCELAAIFQRYDNAFPT